MDDGSQSKTISLLVFYLSLLWDSLLQTQVDQQPHISSDILDVIFSIPMLKPSYYIVQALPITVLSPSFCPFMNAVYAGGYCCDTA